MKARYKAVVDRYAQAIQSGQLPAGTRLPAHEFHYARLIRPEVPAKSASPVFTAAKADGTDPCCFRLHNRHLTGIGCGGKSGR